MCLFAFVASASVEPRCNRGLLAAAHGNGREEPACGLHRMLAIEDRHRLSCCQALSAEGVVDGRKSGVAVERRERTKVREGRLRGTPSVEKNGCDPPLDRSGGREMMFFLALPSRSIRNFVDAGRTRPVDADEQQARGEQPAPRPDQRFQLRPERADLSERGGLGFRRVGLGLCLRTRRHRRIYRPGRRAPVSACFG